jgi:dihydrodipicolinate reductase
MTTIKTIAIVGATGDMGSMAITSYPVDHEVQLQLVGGMENSSSLTQTTMKDKIKSIFAFIASLAISFWLLRHFAAGA